jgi:hypothetical protein
MVYFIGFLSISLLKNNFSCFSAKSTPEYILEELNEREKLPDLTLE